jgi:hypothetical protein
MRESKSLHRQLRINDEGSYLEDTICISIVFIIIVIVIISRQSCDD